MSRLAGQEGALTLINSTTQEQMMPSLFLESVTVTFPFEVVTKQFIGETGPTHRAFGNGYEVEFKIEHDNAAEVVAMANAILAKVQGLSTDEFALQTRYRNADGDVLQITLRDLVFEGIPFELGGRTDFLTSSIKAKGKTFKIQAI